MSTTTLSNVSVTSSLLASFVSSLTSGKLAHSKTTIPTDVSTNAGSVAFGYSKSFNVDNGTPLLLDVSSLSDLAGNTITPAKLCAFEIESDAGNGAAQILTVGGGSNAIIANAESLGIYPGGQKTWDGIAAGGITIDGTHKIIQIANASGTGATVRVSLLLR